MGATNNSSPSPRGSGGPYLGPNNGRIVGKNAGLHPSGREPDLLY
jgi:hypothetical protein